jgi:uncharacterized membrane protein YhhN
MSMNQKSQIILSIYFLLSAVEISGDYFNNFYVILATKPLLMPALIWWMWTQTTSETPMRKWMLTALIGSFFGDTFLLFFPFNENFFLLGLGSFLIAQLVYTSIFVKQIKVSAGQSDGRIRVLWIVVFSAFYFLLMNYLWPDLGEFLLPVVVYGMAICLMGLAAAFRYGKVAFDSYIWVLGGALTFIASDTCIAINQFVYKGEMPFAQVTIMVLYVLAQYMIVNGWLKSHRTVQ